MDWTQYLAIAFVIFAPTYYFYKMHQQDKEFSWLDEVKSSK